jgi:hypothetical protein
MANTAGRIQPRGSRAHMLQQISFTASTPHGQLKRPAKRPCQPGIGPSQASMSRSLNPSSKPARRGGATHPKTPRGSPNQPKGLPLKEKTIPPRRLEDSVHKGNSTWVDGKKVGRGTLPVWVQQCRQVTSPEVIGRKKAIKGRHEGWRTTRVRVGDHGTKRCMHGLEAHGNGARGSREDGDVQGKRHGCQTPTMQRAMVAPPRPRPIRAVPQPQAAFVEPPAGQGMKHKSKQIKETK